MEGDLGAVIFYFISLIFFVVACAALGLGIVPARESLTTIEIGVALIPTLIIIFLVSSALRNIFKR